jgi:hypothetical protein
LLIHYQLVLNQKSKKQPKISNYWRFFSKLCSVQPCQFFWQNSNWCDSPFSLTGLVMQTLGLFDYFFTTVFTVECCLKLISYGFFFHTGAFCRQVQLSYCFPSYSCSIDPSRPAPATLAQLLFATATTGYGCDWCICLPLIINILAVHSCFWL